MNLDTIKSKLQANGIFFTEGKLTDRQTVVGYEKKFRWSWFATQLNTFIVASDYGDTPITPAVIEGHLAAAFKYAERNYKGWPRGLQSGLGVISILLSSNVDEAAVEYCRKLKSGKKWAGFTIPVAVHSEKGEAYYFSSNPIWGRIYYPHFKKLIRACLQ